VSVLVDR